jgi:hypothetical protein
MPNNWQPSKQRPKFGHDQNIGRASFGLNPNKPIVAPPNIWLAEILVVLLVAYDLANIGKKSELHWLKSHWHAK